MGLFARARFSLTPALSQRKRETVTVNLSSNDSKYNNYELFLLVGILCACLPHISFQPLSVIVVSALCLGWRMAFLLKWLPVMPKLLLVLKNRHVDALPLSEAENVIDSLVASAARLQNVA